MTAVGGWVKKTSGGVSFAARITPRASRTAITGVMGNGTNVVLKIALAAPPVEGKANAELIAYLAGILSVSRSQVEVIAGKQSKNKIIRVKDKGADEVAAALARFCP
ncbi:MAG TPA: DUF167 domain-containing protein [Alloacidobacterium sp.]|nr:DUF167 domain-containing protein [Alloacidobacterium sp.]